MNSLSIMLKIPLINGYLMMASFLILLLHENVNGDDTAAVLGTCPYNRHEIAKRQANAGAFAESLYEPTDPVQQLTSTNFDDEVFNKNKQTPKAHLVEFYLSWCGHCRHFAPFYVKFAEDVKNWKSLVEVSAINCALDFNRDLCDSNRVEVVPYLRYFKKEAKQYEDAVVGLTAHRSSGQLRRQLIDMLMKEYDQGHYTDWPSFNYLANITKATEAWSDLPSSTKYLVLVFERPSVDNYTAIETLLDVFPHYPNIAVKRVKEDHPLVEEWDIVEFPSLAVLIRTDDVPIYLSELRQMIAGDVLTKLSLGSSYLEQSNSSTGSRPILVSPPTTKAPSAQSTTPETPETRRAKYYASETDLLLATYYALHTEVPYISKTIAGANFTNLTRFVDALKKYYPKSRDVRDVLTFLKMPTGEELPRSERARRLFSDLSDFLASKNTTGASGDSGPSLTAEEWKQKLTELEARYNNPFPKDANWQHCRGSKWKYRGYTCGLWSLFHTLTINAYLEDGLKPGFDPFDVLRAIKGYVGTYFGCTYCSRHFIEMVTGHLKMEDWVKYASDAVMYLWRAHNTVNKRLAGDSTEDPSFPKMQFPAEFLCTDCHEQKQEKKDQPDWQYRSVLRFLIRYYTDIRPHVEVTMTGAGSNITTTPSSISMGNMTNTMF